MTHLGSIRETFGPGVLGTGPGRTGFADTGPSPPTLGAVSGRSWVATIVLVAWWSAAGTSVVDFETSVTACSEPIQEWFLYHWYCISYINFIFIFWHKVGTNVCKGVSSGCTLWAWRPLLGMMWICAWRCECFSMRYSRKDAYIQLEAQVEPNQVKRPHDYIAGVDTKCWILRW